MKTFEQCHDYYQRLIACGNSPESAVRVYRGVLDDRPLQAKVLRVLFLRSNSCTITQMCAALRKPLSPEVSVESIATILNRLLSSRMIERTGHYHAYRYRLSTHGRLVMQYIVQSETRKS